MVIKRLGRDKGRGNREDTDIKEKEWWVQRKEKRLSE